MQVGIVQTITHYKITGHLGFGGMGDVYRATDSKLDREVGIKFLAERFAQNKEPLTRFDREAKALASLNHPNITGIIGSKEADKFHALVLELVEGEDLSDRLTATVSIPVQSDTLEEIAVGISAQTLFEAQKLESK